MHHCMATRSREEVFRSKVLEAHKYNTYGEDSSDSSTSGSGQEGSKGVSQISPPGEERTRSRLEDPPPPEEEAINVLKKHKEFLRKEQLIAESYRKRLSDLPRCVSSRRQVKDCSTTGGGGGGAGERREPQTQKNRKRKLKKRRAKEKRFKPSNMEPANSKDVDSQV